MSIKISEEIKKYKEFFPLENLENALKMPVSICSEEITAMIPSIVMGTDGPVLESFFLITSHYLCEVRLIASEESFDYISLGTIGNYRFSLSDSVVKKVDESETHYKVAKIELLHDISINFRSQLNYVGLERDGWIKTVLNAIPISVMT